MVIAVAFAWIVVLVLAWLGWQLLRQNGRILLRIEALEKRLDESEFGGPATPEGLPVGSVAPEFELPDLTGELRTLAQFRNQPLLLVLFNPDCGFCRDMAPNLGEKAESKKQKAETAIGSRSLHPFVLIISTGDAEKNRQFFHERKITGPVLLQTDSEVATAYQANGTPSGYLIDAEGTIASELAMGAADLLALAGGKIESGKRKAEIDQGHPHGAGSAAIADDGRPNRFSGRSLVRSKIARDGLKAGTPAPLFRLPRLDGGELALEDLRGSRVLLVFSDPHCGPCNTVAPILEEFHRSSVAMNHAVSSEVGRAVPCAPQRRGLGPNGAQGTARPIAGTVVVMISRGDPKDNCAKVKEHGLTFPVVLQQHWEISRRYAMFATPIAYLVDENGTILRDVAVGEAAILNLLKPATATQAELSRADSGELLRPLGGL